MNKEKCSRCEKLPEFLEPLIEILILDSTEPFTNIKAQFCHICYVGWAKTINNFMESTDNEICTIA